MEIKAIKESDFDQVYELFKEFASYEKLDDYFTVTKDELFALIFKDSIFHMLVAKKDEVIIGFVAYYYKVLTFPGKRVLHVEDIYITKDYRKNGIGSEFFTHLISIAKEKQCLKMQWNCLDWNKDAMKFYEGLGAIQETEWVTYNLVF